MSEFKFKQFSIRQELSAMKVGTDGMLLGAISSHPNPQSILDIGSGTGLIGLMLAQRYPQAKLTLVEIDDSAFEETKFNAERSQFSDRITCIKGDFLALVLSEFDLIVCNPPYHIEDMASNTESRTKARRADSLPTLPLLTKASQLLNNDGVLWTILPTALSESLQHKVPRLNAEHIVQVLPKHNQPANRIICKWSFNDYEKTTEFVVRNDDGSYTDEYVSLTKDFHPHF